MGWVTLTDPATGKTELLGDEDQYRKAQGLPYRKPDGTKVTETELKQIDDFGE